MSKYTHLRVHIPTRLTRSIFRITIKPYPINLNFLWDKIGPKLQHFLIYPDGGSWTDVEHIQYSSVDILGQTEIIVKHRTKLHLHTALLTAVISRVIRSPISVDITHVCI